MRSLPCLLLPVVLLGAALNAQEPGAPSGPEKPPCIQDNSFLVEEAYNQEPGVVQHISTFQRMRQSGDWIYTFTQEWPVGGLAHQLSFTFPLQRVAAAPDGRQAAGDVVLNYRYQWLGDGEAAVAVAPRFTLLLPTGRYDQGRGGGAVGYQVNLPVSVVAGPSMVAHSNLGVTRTPGARNLQGDRADLTVYNLGQSFIWQAGPRFNLMLELAYTRGQVVAGPGLQDRSDSFYVSPGIRWAYNLPGGLQIVPGIAFPLGAGPSRGERAFFFYLSFEHPYRRGR